ncbi:MAG: hypothetical protein EA427_10560 [Spirochaetaceae bacterium]|nr:MAG: hypothetical protein EA427_10560 [Spirochaetaceae bacterium]
MAIQPIDLQTLFVRLSTIGREQSAMKQAVVQAQTVAGEEIAQRSQDAGHTVHETEEVSEGPEQVNEDETGKNPRGRGETRKQEEEEEAGGDEEVFRDPDLGQNVDLSG